MTLAVEDLGRAADWHPPLCVGWHDGDEHRTRRIVTGTRTIWAVYDLDWRPTVHIEGDRVDGRRVSMLPGELPWLTAVRALLEDPAGTAGC